jgi:hypothetical protein
MSCNDLDNREKPWLVHDTSTSRKTTSHSGEHSHFHDLVLVPATERPALSKLEIQVDALDARMAKIETLLADLHKLLATGLPAKIESSDAI